MGNGNAVIIFTKTWRLMNDTSAISICHVSVYKDSKRFILELGGREEVKNKSRNAFSVDFLLAL